MSEDCESLAPGNPKSATMNMATKRPRCAANVLVSTQWSYRTILLGAAREFGRDPCPGPEIGRIRERMRVFKHVQQASRYSTSYQ